MTHVADDRPPMQPEVNPAHWLYRLTDQQWLQAARNELARAYAALRTRQYRPGVAYARRAAGMALNAVLVVRFDDRYGRSYVDHLRALVADEAAPAEPRQAARTLLATPMQPPLLTLRPQGPVDVADAASAVVEYAAALIARG
jgi:HEPN domain-containing protein